MGDIKNIESESGLSDTLTVITLSLEGIVMLQTLKEYMMLIPVIVASSVSSSFLSVYKWFSGSVSFRDVGFIVAMLAVLLFMAFMIWNLRKIKRPDSYILEVYNALGGEEANFRSEYKTYDVAVSYMQMYKRMYPHYRFVLVSRAEGAKKTVHKWIE